MKYEILENVDVLTNNELNEFETFSAYQALVRFEEPVSQYKINDDFQIYIYDRFSEREIIIDKDNFESYGLTNIGSIPEHWENDSFINNGGILVYFTDANTLFIKLLARCINEYGYKIGFNTSKINIYLNDEQNIKAELFALTWPRLYRNREISQDDRAAADPILPESNKRSAYDFDIPLANEYVPGTDRDADIPIIIAKNYEYNSTSSMYVNTPSITTTETYEEDYPRVPLYISDVSAFYTPIYDTREYVYGIDDSSISGSCILDTSTGEVYPLTIRTPIEGTTKFTFPISLSGNYVCDYVSEMDYTKYIQLLSVPNGNYKENRVMLNARTKPGDKIPGTIPDDNEPLLRLIVELVEYTPANQLLTDEIYEDNYDGHQDEIAYGTAKFKITNPNVLYLDKSTLCYEQLTASTLNGSTELDTSTFSTDGIAYLTVTNIRPIIEINGVKSLIYRFWIELPSHPIYGTDTSKMKTATYADGIVKFVYNKNEHEKPKPGKLPTPGPLEIIFTDITATDGTIIDIDNGIPEITASSNPSKIGVYIYNRNVNLLDEKGNRFDYLQDLNTNSWFVDDKNISISDMDMSNYAADKTLPYVYYEINNLTMAGEINVSAFIDKEIPQGDYDAGISKSKMKELTSAHNSLTIKLFNKQPTIPDPWEWLQMYSLYTPGDITLNGSIIYTNLPSESSYETGWVQANKIRVENGSTVDANLVCKTLEFASTRETINGAIYTPHGQGDWVGYDQKLHTVGVPRAEPEKYIEKDIPQHTVYVGTKSIIIGQNQTRNGLGFDLWGGTHENDENDGGILVGEDKITTRDNGSALQDNQGMAYKSLNLQQNSTLILYPGDYYFDTIQIQNGAKIVCNTSETGRASGAVRLWCKTKFNMEDNTNIIMGESAFKSIWHLVIYTDNDNPNETGIGLQVKVNAEGDNYPLGTIIAPKGKIELRNNAVWVGNMWGKKIELTNSSKVYKGIPSTRTINNIN